MPAWTEHVIWWHVYPLGFTGADTTGTDRTPTLGLRQLESWLDYLLELGANGLALGPVFTSLTHGYDTTDYFEVDPRLGSNADLEHLIGEAHARGIRVMLDGVFNHVGRDFAPLRTAFADPTAPENDLFATDASGRVATFEGHDALVAFNHTNPLVADLVFTVMDHWLRLGIDAWRLDAAYSVPVPFWAGVLSRVREAHPEVYVLGEVLHGDYTEFVTDGLLDSVTQYELWQAIWHATEEANFYELDWALQRNNEFLASFVPYTFIGNHDVTRIASQVSDGRHHAHALALLLTLGGTPAIYYGDERGLSAIKEERFGGDDAIRPAYPAHPGDLPTDGAAVFALHQLLIGIRRRNPWLHTATSRSILLANTQLALEVTAGDHSIIVALNIGDEVLILADDPRGTAPGATPLGERQLLAGDVHRADGSVEVPPHGWAILS